jgi:DNA polymerase II
MNRVINGWLFDIYPTTDGVTLWFIGKDGEKYRAHYNFVPSFFLHLDQKESARAKAVAHNSPANISFVQTKKKELFSNDAWDVLQVFVHDPTKFKEVVWFYEKFFPHFTFFNSDLLVAQEFLFETRLFALAFGEYEIDPTGNLVKWTLHDSQEAVEYELPPFSIMMIRNANDFVPPKYQKTLQLEITYEEQTFTLEQESPVDVLESLNWHIHRFDPDIILTEYGDSILMPKITELAKNHNIPMLLNRDTALGYMTSKESTFFQYGKVMHKDGMFELAGRWHVDVQNSFAVSESELDGLFELVRITQLPGQRQSRASIGTGLSSLQLSWAYRNNYLIPSKKREPEEFKSAATLLLADRGGLTFSPPVGYHEDVAELDFVSMYPTIMVEYNVSPETVNCRCCNNHEVPELGYSICEKREGIVGATLRMVIAKRAYYKKKRKEYKGKNDVLYQSYDRKQSALKWMLVSCFGYLGYKNARFGRIEAHESVNAYSREFILTAKEVAEAKGYTLLHGIIDCIWIKKDGATEKDYEDLCKEIHEKVGIDISLEGIYNWLLFPPSKTDSVISTTNHYVGCYRNGDLKMRGIEARRKDTSKLVKCMQTDMLEKMKEAKNIEEIKVLIPDILEIARNNLSLIRSGHANPMDLVLRRNISKEASEYSNNNLSAVVTKLIEQAGIHLMAGESIQYIIIDQSGKKNPDKAKPLSLYSLEDGYDIEKYSEFLIKAVETLFEPFGYTEETLQREFGLFKEKPKKKTKKVENFEFDFGI